MKEGNNWDIVIVPQSNLLEVNLKEVWRYRDLIFMFVKRDFVSFYKQTILGPLWFIIQPLITTLTYVVIFGSIANLSTEGQPAILFYLSGIIFWNFFSTILLRTSETFTSNAGVFSKVYFPRLTVPIATVCFSFVSFFIQFSLFIVIFLFYYFFMDYHPVITYSILLIPILILIVAFFSLGLGIIISSLTTKYRDLKFLVSFGVQLLMYAAPIVYPMSAVSNEKLAFILKLNPITPVIEIFRCAILSSGSFDVGVLWYSITATCFVLIIGVIIFNKVEKTFMDTI